MSLLAFVGRATEGVVDSYFEPVRLVFNSARSTATVVALLVMAAIATGVITSKPNISQEIPQFETWSAKQLLEKVLHMALLTQLLLFEIVVLATMVNKILRVILRVSLRFRSQGKQRRRQRQE